MKEFNKRFLSMLFTAILILGLVACGGDNTGNSSYDMNTGIKNPITSDVKNSSWEQVLSEHACRVERNLNYSV